MGRGNVEGEGEMEGMGERGMVDREVEKFGDMLERRG